MQWFLSASKEQKLVNSCWKIQLDDIFHSNTSFSKRTCRCGAGKENTKGMGDTPGFPLQNHPEVIHEDGKTYKLKMPRNHLRLNQTSRDLLASWRGNCDVQILIYKTSPYKVDVREISKVTDYVVAYNCKGSTTLNEEKETNKSVIMAMDDVTGDKLDLKRVCKKVMNKAASRRLISKQESCVLLGNLPLTLCSENIETVSISNTVKVKIQASDGIDRRFLASYANRPSNYHHMSLHQYFFQYREIIHKKPPAIPHYVGVMGYPTYPVSKSYAKHVLLVYKPWIGRYPDFSNWNDEFNAFIRSKYCPLSARMQYDRVVQRYFDGTQFVEPVSKDVDHSMNSIVTEDEVAILLAGMGAGDFEDHESWILNNIHKGLDYNWDVLPKVSCRKTWAA